VQRVLALEAASYKTPERVETVARSLLGMAPPTDDRIVMMNGVKQSAAPASSVPRPAGSVVAQDRPAHP
jgi:cell division protein FtsL